MTARTDVLIVRAGPAGVHLARKLAQQGVKVLLTDRLKGLHTNAFSSAGTLWEVLARFDGLVRFQKPRDLAFLVSVLFPNNLGREARKTGSAYLWRSLKWRLGFV